MGYAELHKSQGAARPCKAVPPNAGERGCPSFLSLINGERVVLVTHPSKINYLGHFVFGPLFVLPAFAVPFVVPIGVTGLIPLAAIFLIGAALLGRALVGVFSTVYVVTDRRVVAKQGLIAQSVSEVRVDDIRGVNFSRSIWQAIVGVGNVCIGTAATEGAEIVIRGVPKAKDMVQTINALRSK